MGFQIRAARASDTAAAVPLMYSSGPAAFDYVFARDGTDATPFLAHAFADGSGEFGHRNHVVGEFDGHVVAVGAGFGHTEAAAFTSAAARQILHHYGWRAGGPIVRGLRTERVIRPPGRGEHYLAHLAVAQEFRGHGFGTRLIAWLLAQARGLSRAWATLDVALDNPRAEALYTRLGFRLECERPSLLRNAHGAVPTQRRLRLALDAP